MKIFSHPYARHWEKQRKIAGCQLIGIGAYRPHEEKILLPLPRRKKKKKKPLDSLFLSLFVSPSPPSGSVFLLLARPAAGRKVDTGHYGEPGMEIQRFASIVMRLGGCFFLRDISFKGGLYLLVHLLISLFLSDPSTIHSLAALYDHCTISMWV